MGGCSLLLMWALSCLVFLISNMGKVNILVTNVDKVAGTTFRVFAPFQTNLLPGL